MVITWINTNGKREVYCWPKTIGDALALVKLLNESVTALAQIDYVK